MQTIIANTLTPRQHRTATLIFFFLSGFGYSTWASRIPSIQKQLGLNEAQLGGMLFAMPLGVIFTLPITGRLLSRFSSRSIMLFGAVFYNCMLGLLGFATQTWQLAVILFCFGSSRNLLNLSMNAQSVEIQALYDRSIITTFHGIWSLAGFAGAAFGYLFISSNIPLQYHLLTVSILLVSLSLFAYPKTLYKLHEPQPKRALFIFPGKDLLIFALIAFASMACENVMYDWSGIYFEKAVKATHNLATSGFVVYMIAMTTGRLLGDKLVNKLGTKTILSYSGIFIFVGLLIAVFFPYPVSAGFGFMLTGFGVSCIVPLIFALAGKSVTTNSGVAIASVSTISYFGFLVVPPSVGFIAQAAGLQWSFGIIAVFGAIIFLLVSFIKERK